MNIFTQHPTSVNESYCQHLLVASQFAIKLLVASAACFVHALLPFLCQRTGSKVIKELHLLMLEKREHKSQLLPK